MVMIDVPSLLANVFEQVDFEQIYYAVRSFELVIKIYKSKPFQRG